MTTRAPSPSHLHFRRWSACDNGVVVERQHDDRARTLVERIGDHRAD